MQETIALTFYNNPTENRQFPEVTLALDGTDLVVKTLVTDKYQRLVMSQVEIQERLERLFGVLRWEIEREASLRGTLLFGFKDLLSVSVIRESIFAVEEWNS